MRKTLLAGVVVLAISTVAHAASLSFEFSTGLGPNFDVVKNRDFWTVGTDSTGLRISKPFDDGSTFSTGSSGFPNEHDAIAGAASRFTLDGDFRVSVDYDWNFLETPTFSGGDTGALIWLIGSGFRTSVKHFALWSGARMTNLLPGGASATLPPNTPETGQLVFERVGSILSAYATNRDGVLQLVGSHPAGYGSGPVEVWLMGLQAQDPGSGNFRKIDPRGPMDLSFNNLAITADRLDGVVPEPTSSALFLLGLLPMAWIVRRRA